MNQPTTINQQLTTKKVFVGMSGGVDSSVSAYLLKEAGADVTGVFMRCYNIDGCAERDAEDARRVAEHLNIPFYTWDFEEEYKKKVVEYMVADYAAGRTPNPDVACNREIKFGLFLRRALSLGADHVATGHYVRLGCSSDALAQGVSSPSAPLGARATSKSYPSQEHQTSLNTAQALPVLNGTPTSLQNLENDSVVLKHKTTQKQSPAQKFCLIEGRDKNKDQSYFLWTLTQDDLRHCLFPLGDYLKPEVREIARKAGLPTAEKKDSQGICFLGQVNLSDFLSEYIPKKRGDVVDVEGRKVGEHEGAAFYTVGQRRGLDLKEKNKTLGVSGSGETKPHYVESVDVKSNVVTVAEGSENPALLKREVALESVNFINPDIEKELEKGSVEVMARIRYRQPLFRARLERGREYKLVFNEPQKFVAPGQSAVFYSLDGDDGREMLGGGVIV